MRIVITGASGFVGQSLVGLLAGQGHRLLLVGRNPALLSCKFPTHESCGYDDLEMRAAGWDRLVHLAVVNNNSTAGPEEFHAVNVDLTMDVALKAERAGIARLVNVSTIHALDERNASAYAESKRAAERALGAMTGINVVTVFLPLVYGERWAGRMAALNTLPRPIARLLFGLFAALKPTVNVRRLAEFVPRETRPDRDSPFILSDGQRTNPWYRTATRVVDLAIAVSVLVALGWALVVIWALVRLRSPGPGIFAQTRLGRHARPFVCYKFRTMKVGTPQSGTHEACASAIMPFGEFLRSTKLDELPQVWNLLRNEMTLIGPRPCLPVQTELIEARISRGVLAVKPGISGLAQINGIDMSDPQKLSQWDARYIALQCLTLDLKIALATIIGGGYGDRIVK